MRAGHIRDVLPQGVTRGEISSARVPGSVAQSGKTAQTFHVSPLQIQGGDGPRGGGAAALIWLVRNAHASGAAHKSQEGGALQQKNSDLVEEAGCGICG